MKNSEADTSNPETSEWYERAFQAEYLEVYPARTVEAAEREVEAALRWLSPGSGDRCLDLCCGAGRHSHWLAKSTVDLHALDLSAELLEQAQQKLPEKVKLHRGDMRQLPFEDQFFDHVMMFFTSFGYFEEDEENSRVLAEVARVVRPGGGFLLDLPDRESTLKSLVPNSQRRVGELTIEEARSITADGKRVEKQVSLKGPSGEEGYIESVRLFSAEEVTSMLKQEGWGDIRCYGDWNDQPHRSGESPRMIFSARRSQAESK